MRTFLSSFFVRFRGLGRGVAGVLGAKSRRGVPCLSNPLPQIGARREMRPTTDGRQGRGARPKRRGDIGGRF